MEKILLGLAILFVIIASIVVFSIVATVLVAVFSWL